MPANPIPSDFPRHTLGVILAGGAGARLGGVRKPELRVGGQRLIDIAIEAMSRQASETWVAVGKGTTLPPTLPSSLRVVSDTGAGPAAALLAVAGQLETRGPSPEYLLMSPGDAPFAPADFISAAARGLDANTQCVIGAYQGNHYPTHALWRTGALRKLAEANARAEGRSLFSLLDQVTWTPEEITADDGCNPFFNINSPADLVVAARRSARQKSASFS